MFIFTEEKMFKEIFENKGAKKIIIGLLLTLLVTIIAIVVLSLLLSSSCAQRDGVLSDNNELLKENNSILSELLDKHDTSEVETTSKPIKDDESTEDKEDIAETKDMNKETSEAASDKNETTQPPTTSEEATSRQEETTTSNNVENNNQSVSNSGLPYGKLSVNSDGILVGENGNVAKLQGVSTHGLSWFPQYVNADSVRYCKEQLGANTFRLAMYTAEYAGYCEGGDQNALKQIVCDGVKYATDNNMYVIIDWHVLNDNNPNKYKDQAIAFFREMSAKYKDYDNVIYEICNEPCGGTSWTDVKNYALQVIPVIRENDKDAIIIVGTPNWSQDVDIVANDRITGYDNIMYAFHFYAATHRQDMRNKVTTARNSKLPIFVSEFGICSADGNGWIDENEANTWISFLEQNNISYVMWNLCNKAEASAMINSWNSSTTWWNYDDLSQAGKWLARTFGGAIAEGR